MKCAQDQLRTWAQEDRKSTRAPQHVHTKAMHISLPGLDNVQYMLQGQNLMKGGERDVLAPEHALNTIKPQETIHSPSAYMLRGQADPRSSRAQILN